MSTQKKVFTNTLSMTIGKILGDIATFVFLIYFARVFGTSLFGQYAFAMSLGGFLSILIGLGLNRLIVREISKDKSLNAKYMGNMLITQSVMAIFCWFLITLFILFSSFDNDSKLIILIIGAYQILYKLTKLIHSQFYAHEDMQYSAYLEIYHKIIILLIGSLSIVIWKDPVITLLIYPISAFSMFLIGLRTSFKRYGRPDYNIDIPFIKDLLLQAWPFLILIILSQLYDRIGVIMLTVLQGDEATGIYAASDRFVITFITAIGMFGTALFPVMSRFAKDAPEKLIVTYERSMRILLVTILPVSTLLYLLSHHIMLLLYGEMFIKSAEALTIMTWSILPSGLNILLSGILIATNQQAKVVKVELIIILGFVIECFLLIPTFSYIGLAYAKLFTSIALCFMFSWHLSKTFHYSPILKIIKAPLLACIASIFVFKFMINQDLWMAIWSASLTCVIILLLTGAVKYHDISYARDILLKK